MAAHQAPRPWDSPGKNTGVRCLFLLQCGKVKSKSEVGQSCPTLSNPMDHSLPGSSVHGIFQARALEWGATAFSDIAPNFPIIELHAFIIYSLLICSAHYTVNSLSAGIISYYFILGINPSYSA